MPVVFVSHGAGPAWLLDLQGFMHKVDKSSPSAAVMRSFTSKHLSHIKPKAIVVVSAHWESKVIGITGGSSNSLYFDYGGFPRECYTLSYPAPAAPSVAQRIKTLLDHAQIESRVDARRGLDHGVFIPLLLMYPDASIPIVEVSIHPVLDAAFHIKLGQALAPLRNEGVLILCSGSFLHGGWDSGLTVAKAFDSHLTDIVTNTKYTTAQRLEKAKEAPLKAPHYETLHPRDEHFMPFFVALGAAGDYSPKAVTKVNSVASASKPDLWDYALAHFIYN